MTNTEVVETMLEEIIHDLDLTYRFGKIKEEAGQNWALTYHTEVVEKAVTKVTSLAMLILSFVRAPGLEREVDRLTHENEKLTKAAEEMKEEAKEEEDKTST